MLSVNDVVITGFDNAVEMLRDLNESENKVKINERSYRLFIEHYASTISIISEEDLATLKDKMSVLSQRVFLKKINVDFELTAPLYFWNSIGEPVEIVPKLFTEKLTIDKFSTDHMLESGVQLLKANIASLNNTIEEFFKTKSRESWMQVVSSLPTSFNFTKRLSMSYLDVTNLIAEHDKSSITEWTTLIDELKKFPHIEKIFNIIRR